ncbi:MAG: hypothetical protein ACI8V0_002748 [Pseudohongiellaceae bacterium]
MKPFHRRIFAMKYFRSIKTAFPAVGFLLCVSPSSANEFYLLNLSVGEESNVPRGIDAFHELESTFMRAGVTAGKRIQLGINDSLTFTGNLNYRRFDELRGFDRIELGAGASYRYKFGFGPFAPAANASVNFNVENGAGQARDTEVAQIEFSVGKRFQSGFTLGVGIDYQRNTTNYLEDDPAVEAFDYDPLNSLSNELFDFESISAFFAVDYEFSSGWRASLNYRRINGFTVASTTKPSLKIYKISDAFYSDPAFSTSGSETSWFGYLLETNSDQWEGALSIPLSMDTSIDFSVNWTDISAPESGNYQNTIFAITFIHSL